MSEGDYVAKRWATPVVPVAINKHNQRIVQGPNRRMQDVDVTLKPEDVERMRLGYVCVQCWEPHEEAFPEKCSLCGFGMREKQPDWFKFNYEGPKHVGPTTSIDYELDHLDDWAERDRFYPGSQILVPNGW